MRGKSNTLVLLCVGIWIAVSDSLRAKYTDRVQAIWESQIIAALLAWPHEHQTASTVRLTDSRENFLKTFPLLTRL